MAIVIRRKLKATPMVEADDSLGVVWNVKAARQGYVVGLVVAPSCDASRGEVGVSGRYAAELGGVRRCTGVSGR